jgi:hypothetical protein
MGWQMVWVDDATDERAERDGCLTYAEAGRQLGRSVTWVQARIEQNILRTTVFAGRKYVDADSVAKLVNAVGYGPSLTERLEVLRSQGRAHEAQALMDQAHREYHPEQYEQGYTAPAGSAASEVQNDFGTEFLAKYGR